MTYSIFFLFFFFNDTATTEIYTLSLHDALPISEATKTAQASELRTVTIHTSSGEEVRVRVEIADNASEHARGLMYRDRKSTRLNSSHANISYAVFCLKKKKNTETHYNGVRNHKD